MTFEEEIIASVSDLIQKECNIPEVVRAKTILVIPDFFPVTLELENPKVNVLVMDDNGLRISRDKIHGPIVASFDETTGRLKFRRGKDFPHADVLITGCQAFSDDGYVYADHPAMKRSYQAMRFNHRVTARTCRILIACEDQRTDVPYYSDCLMRAHYLILPPDIIRVDWKEGKQS